MAFGFILLVLPALALARIDVGVLHTVDGYSSRTRHHFKGEDIGIISETERTTFNVTDGSLKDCVRAYFGKRPDHVFVRDTTRWGNLDRVNGWYLVTRTLVPRSSKITGRSSEITVLYEQTFENNSTVPTTFNVGISQSAVHRVWSSHTSGLSGVKINYDIKLKFINGTEDMTFNYISSWDKEIRQSRTAIVGPSSNMRLTLQPGETVDVRLECIKCIREVTTEYDAHLAGSIAFDYNELYEGYKLFTVPINTCMKSVGISNQKTFRETVFIEYFAVPRVVIDRRGRTVVDMY